MHPYLLHYEKKVLIDLHVGHTSCTLRCENNQRELVVQGFASFNLKRAICRCNYRIFYFPLRRGVRQGTTFTGPTKLYSIAINLRRGPYRMLCSKGVIYTGDMSPPQLFPHHVLKTQFAKNVLEKNSCTKKC